MDICPQCTHFLLKNKNSCADQRLCPNCGWKGMIWLEDGIKYIKLDKVIRVSIKEIK